MDARVVSEAVGHAIELAGVATIVIGIVVAAMRFAWHLAHREPTAYRRVRRAIGHTLLLGLELFVAADIVATVGVDPSFQSLGVLAILVVVRTFLGWALEVETEGRWPWQPSAREELPRDPRRDVAARASRSEGPALGPG